MNDSFDTAQSVLEDLQSGTLDLSGAKKGDDFVMRILQDRGEYVCLCVCLSNIASYNGPDDLGWLLGFN